MKYFVTIRGRTREIEVREDSILIDGVAFDAAVRTIEVEPARQLRIGDRFHSIIARSGDASGTWNIHVAGQSFQADVIDERTRAIRAMSGASSPTGTKKILAPMPGLVVRLNVSVGDSVIVGQGLVVVEAMKMENELKAPSGGTVTRIDVAPGDTVEKGTLLISIE